jgi:hypothetical protein
MNPWEEDLQNEIERNDRPDSDDLDAQSYRVVFRALKKDDPAKQLSRSFEDRIIALVLEKRRREERRERFWFGFGVFLIFIAFVVAIVMTSFSLNFGFLNAMADYKGLALFAIAFIALLNWIDRKLGLGRKTQL